MRLKLGVLLAVLVVAGTTAMLPGREAHAAVQELFLSQTCVNGRLDVTFSWRSGPPGHVAEWLDLSIFDNGWQPGTFLANGPIAPRFEQSLAWQGLLPNTPHYARVNLQMPDGSWDPSPTFAFTTTACGPAPQQPSPPPPGMRRELAPIESAEFQPGPSEGRYVLHVRAGLPGGCARQAGHEIEWAGNDIRVRVYNFLPSEPVPCTAIYGIYETSIDLGPGLVRGQTYRVDLNGMMLTLMP